MSLTATVSRFRRAMAHRCGSSLTSPLFTCPRTDGPSSLASPTPGLGRDSRWRPMPRRFFLRRPTGRTSGRSFYASGLHPGDRSDMSPRLHGRNLRGPIHRALLHGLASDPRALPQSHFHGLPRSIDSRSAKATTAFLCRERVLLWRDQFRDPEAEDRLRAELFPPRRKVRPKPLQKSSAKLALTTGGA